MQTKLLLEDVDAFIRLLDHYNYDVTYYYENMHTFMNTILNRAVLGSQITRLLELTI